MSLLVVLVVGALAYVGLMYVRTFQKMVDELREMRFKCFKEGGNGHTSVSSKKPETTPLNPSELKSTIESMLGYLKTKAA
jgi:23S rRNA maturation mini-RNase III